MAADRSILVFAFGLGAACSDSTNLSTVAPELLVNPSEVAYGEVPLGAVKRVAVEVRNAGLAGLAVEAERVPSDLVAEGWALPVTLGPGASQTLDLVYRPTSTEEPLAGSYVVESSAGIGPIVVSGAGVAGNVSLFPSEVSFEDTSVGTVRSVELVVENGGLDQVAGTLEIEGAPLEVYELTMSEVVVPPQSTATVQLSYRPQVAGRNDGRIRFNTCSGRCGVETTVRASAIEPIVALEPSTLDFGSVGLDQTRTQVLSVRNRGGESRTLVDVRLRGAPEFEVSPEAALPLVLGPSETIAIDVRFTPRAITRSQASIEVELEPTGAGANVLEAVAVGTGVGPRFAVQPSILSFGIVTDAQVHRRTALALNAGSSQLQLSSVALDGPPEFRLAGAVGPVVLGSSESFPVVVEFEPSLLGTYTATLTFTSDVSMQETLSVPVVASFAEQACQLGLRPTTLNFGAVVPGFSRELSLRLQNEGDDPCLISSGSFRAPLEATIRQISPNPFPLELTAGNFVDLRFVYSPVEERSAKALFELEVDDPLFPRRSISLSGTGESFVDLQAIPRVVDFGPVRPICPPEARQIQIANFGAGPAVVASIALEDSPASFRLESPPTPFTLGVGAVQTMTVRFGPTNEAPAEGRVIIEFDEVGFALVVPLLGEGDNNPRVEDVHIQQAKDDVDVLFVVDDSCSMLDEQAALANNFQSFIEQAELRQVNFRIGVTTTTVLGTGGRLVGQPLSPTTPDLARSFQSQTNVGVSGSGLEQGLEAIRGAIRRADRNLSPNSDLLRNKTNKVFVVVSDEDDSSPASVLSYSSQIRQRYGSSASTAVISGGPNGCISPTGTAFPAPRYEQFARNSNGLEASMCGDWGRTLRDIGQVAFGLEVRFRFSRTADLLEPVEVFLDGVPVSSADYTLRADGITLRQPPAPGASILLRYTPACGS